MQRIDLSITDPAEQLAVDEAMLCAADAGDVGESIRTWQFQQATVIVGRGSRVNKEVDQAYCRQQQIPVLRRCSGGAAVVGGPGCLMYSIVLNVAKHGDLRQIDLAHRHVMDRVLAALQQQLADAVLQGICDLTWNDQKCSGNSLKYARRHLLYHGTILYDADLDLLDRCLLQAPRQPEYRGGRDHRSFVTNVPIDPQQMSGALAAEFEAADTISDQASVVALSARIRQLRQQRYDLDAWHFRH